MERDTELQKMLAAPSMGAALPARDVGASSPLRTALILLALGFIGGGGYWVWAEGVPGFDRKAAAGSPSGVEGSYAVIQYAESLIDGRMEASLIGNAPAEPSSPTGPTRLAVSRRHANAEAQKEFDRGNSLMSMGEYSVAVRHFAEAVRHDPQWAEAHYRLGLAYVQAGDLRSARRTRTRLARMDADLANLLGNLIDD